MYKYFKNRKGVALVTIILVMVVLMILGVSLISTSLVEAKHAIRQEKMTQAHYIARSGAEGIAAAIINDPNKPDKLTSLLGATDPETGSISNGTYEANVTGLTIDDPIFIESQGTVGDIKKSVKLEINKFDFSELLMFGDTININGNSAKLKGGDIFYNTSYNFFDSIVEDGDIIQKSIIFDEPEIPTGITLSLISDIVFTGSYKEDEIPNPYHHVQLNEVSLTSTNHELTIEANGDTYIKADSFRINGGKITLKGTGRVFLFTNLFEGGGNFFNEPGSDVTFTICIPNGGSLDMGGTPTFEGAIYAPNASVDLSGTVDFTGSIIAKTIDGGGNINLTQKPMGVDHLYPTIYLKSLWQ